MQSHELQTYEWRKFSEKVEIIYNLNTLGFPDTKFYGEMAEEVVCSVVLSNVNLNSFQKLYFLEE